jgi:hypothetical protein
MLLHPYPIPQNGASAEWTGGIHGKDTYGLAILTKPANNFVHQCRFSNTRGAGKADHVGAACIRIQLLKIPENLLFSVIYPTDQASCCSYVTFDDFLD